MKVTMANIGGEEGALAALICMEWLTEKTDLDDNFYDCHNGSFEVRNMLLELGGSLEKAWAILENNRAFREMELAFDYEYVYPMMDRLYETWLFEREHASRQSIFDYATVGLLVSIAKNYFLNFTTEEKAAAFDQVFQIIEKLPPAERCRIGNTLQLHAAFDRMRAKNKNNADLEQAVETDYF